MPLKIEEAKALRKDVESNSFFSFGLDKNKGSIRTAGIFVWRKT